jgi:hypothetical protein
MNHELICRWLDLPETDWPPDHYRLLGLTAGESDGELVEHRVHERLAAVRRHQLANPEQATEAMNRLAQAYVCLTDPEAKRAYDADLLGKPLPPAEPAPPAMAELAPAPVQPAIAVADLPPPALAIPMSPDPLAWLYGPWTGLPGETPVPGKADTQLDLNGAPTLAEALPANGDALPVLPYVPSVLAVPGSSIVVPPPAVPGPGDIPTALPAEPVDPFVEAAQTSSPARRGLGTKRGLYHRVARTRELLWAWEQIGKYLKGKRKLTRRSEAADLIRQLGTVRQLVREFPPILGRAGQPGYLVMALARQQMIVQTFQALLPSQREVLARDWEASYTLLAAHRQFLRQELRSLRRKSFVGQALRAVRAGLADHPGWVLLVLALVAFVVALWNSVTP